MTIADGIDGSPTEYVFSYGTGPPISVSTGSTLPCSSSVCQYIFRDLDFQVQQYNVSVAARNVVGVGNASTPVTVGMWCKKFNVKVVQHLTTNRTIPAQNSVSAGFNVYMTSYMYVVCTNVYVAISN